MAETAQIMIDVTDTKAITAAKGWMHPDLYDQLVARASELAKRSADADPGFGIDGYIPHHWCGLIIGPEWLGTVQEVSATQAFIQPEGAPTPELATSALSSRQIHVWKGIVKSNQ